VCTTHHERGSRSEWALRTRSLIARTLAVLLVAGSPVVSRAESSLDDKALQDALADLRGDDDAKCAAAADVVMRTGLVAIEWAATRSTEFSANGWRKFADAVAAVEPRSRSPVAIALVAAAPRVPSPRHEAVVELVKKLAPTAFDPTDPAELARFVRRNVIEEHMCDDFGFEESVTIRGRVVVPVVVAVLEGESRTLADQQRASALLRFTVQPEDIPALRRLLRARASAAAAPLVRLEALGYAAAGDALLDALRTGVIDGVVAEALNELPARRVDAVVDAFRQRIARAADPVPDEDVRFWAIALADLDARSGAALLASCAPRLTDCNAREQVAEAMARLGSKDGVAELVRIVLNEPLQHRSSESGASAEPLQPFEPLLRRVALDCLDAVVSGVSMPRNGWRKAPHDVWRHNPRTELEAVANEVRDWWRAHRETLRFDAEAGRWTSA
jgi:hypothetical protein